MCDSQIVHHNPCFNLSILHNNPLSIYIYILYISHFLYFFIVYSSYIYIYIYICIYIYIYISYHILKTDTQSKYMWIYIIYRCIYS